MLGLYLEIENPIFGWQALNKCGVHFHAFVSSLCSVDVISTQTHNSSCEDEQMDESHNRLSLTLRFWQIAFHIVSEIFTSSVHT